MRATIDSSQSRSQSVFRASSANILRSQLGRRQLFTILLVVAIPIALLSVNLYFNQRNNLIDEKLQELDAVAGVEESVVNLYFENLENTLNLTANSRNITIGVDVLARIPNNVTSAVSIAQVLEETSGEDKLFETIGVYSVDGTLLVSVNDDREELVSGEAILAAPEFIAGQSDTYIGTPFFDDEASETDIIITSPIFDNSDNLIGVLFAIADLDRLGTLIRENIVESEDIYLIGLDGSFLTNTLSLPLGEQTEAASSSGIDTALTGESGSSRYDNYRSVNVIGAYRWLEAYNMALVVESNTDDVVPSPTDLLVGILPTIALSIVLAVVLVVLSVNQLIRPLIYITTVARRFSYGDLDERVADGTGYGELRALGSSFNEMADQVQRTVGGLEGQIATRTRDLQAVVDVTTRIATILNVEQLLDDVTDLTKERFSLYHAHIYLYHRDEDRFILTAGAGYVGEQMVAEHRSIDFRHPKSIVALAGRSRKSVQVGDVTESPDFLSHPLLPDTRSELAIPLIARGELLGVLDMQSDKVFYFETDIQSTLEVLGTQIATALSNARLFANAERTSRHEQALGVITRSIEGATNVDDVLQTAVRELGKALRVPHTAIELQLTNTPVEDET